MKVFGSLASVLILVSQFAFGQSAALVIKTNVTGFTLPEYARTETCEVFQNRVVLTHKFGGFDENSFSTQEVRRITLSNSIAKVLEIAATETLSKSDNYLCDGPSTSIQSVQAGKKLVLYATGGCGSPRLERQGGSSRMLIDLVDKYCPVTHDIGVQNTTLND